MTKYTKRQYLADLAANEAKKAANAALLDSFADRAESGESVNEMAAEWNAAHDREYEIECERHSIERRYAQRHWNWQDYAHAELVSANID